MKSSIKVKSAAFLGVLLLLTVCFLSVFVLGGIKSNQKKNYESYLSSQAKLANLYINQEYAAYSGDKTLFLKNRGREMAKQIGLLTGMHVVLYDMMEQEAGDSFPQEEKVDIKDTIAYSLEGKISYQIMGDSLDYLAPVSIFKVQTGVVRLIYNLGEGNAFYNNILRLFVIIGGITFFISFIIGYTYFNRITTDILKLKGAVEHIKSGFYDNIPTLRRKDELNELRQGIYFMSRKIQENIGAMEEEQEKLRLAVERLRLLERQQKDFIGNITHEFKTPLTVIKAYADLIEMYNDDPELMADAKARISAETTRLYEMVEKTLNLASLEKYDFEYQAEEIEVKKLLLDLCGRMEGKIKKFDLCLNTSLEEAAVWADKESMTHIFMNLLDNAIKYNKSKGEIDLNSYTKDSYVYIEINNTGSSIPNEAREKIFEPFYRVDKDRSRETGGAGLGLALVKKLVESQGGEIQLLDEAKGKNIFQVKFPIFK